MHRKWLLTKNRMREKAFIGDDGSQFSRKRSVRPCGLNSKGLSLCLSSLVRRIRDRTLRNGTLDWNTGRNVQRSADVSGNARHFCEVEFNSIVCETSRLETQPTTANKFLQTPKNRIRYRILFLVTQN